MTLNVRSQSQELNNQMLLCSCGELETAKIAKTKGYCLSVTLENI